MALSDPQTYLWLLPPLAAYLVLAVLLELIIRRLPSLANLRLPLHLLILGLGLEISFWRMPEGWTHVLSPYARAILAFGAIVLVIQAVEGLSVGYFMVRLRGRHVPPILRRFLLLVAYFLVATIILRTFLNLDVTSLVATSAVVSFVVGLASQDLLGSILAGVVIGVERPVVIGNWITIDGVEGKVVDITWRRTMLETRNGDTLILPNSQIMKTAIVNHALPSNLHRITMKVGVHYRHPPNAVKQAMTAAARLCPHVLDSPAPSVFLDEFGDSAIVYRLNMWINDMSVLEQAKEQVNTHIWYQFKRRSLEIPFPIRTLHRPTKAVPENTLIQEMIAQLVPLLKNSELFASVADESLEKLGRRMSLETYGAREVLFQEKQEGDTMYMLVSGSAQVLKKMAGQEEKELAVLQPGSIMGEMSLLLGQPRTATIRFLEDSQVIRMDRQVFKKLAAEHEQFLEHLTKLVEARRNENEALASMFKAKNIQTKEGRLQAVLSHIRSVLKL